ncbi:unnamed protein product, partial [Symbiodinium sp. CCMP2456]
LRRLEEEWGDLGRFTPSEVEELLMGCPPSEPGDRESSEPQDREPKSSEPQDREPKSFEPGDREPKSFEHGDREPKSFEPGDLEPKSFEPGDLEQPTGPAVAVDAELVFMSYSSGGCSEKVRRGSLEDAIDLDDSSSETDRATMEALVDVRSFVHPDAVATDEPKGKAKRATGDEVPENEDEKKKRKKKENEAPQEPNRTFAGRPPPQTTPFLWRFQFAAEAYKECPA